MTGMNYRLVPALDQAQQEAINGHLRGYNRAQNAAFFAACDLAENAPQPLNLIAADASGRQVGGLMAETEFQWLKTLVMAVAEPERRRGIGRRLLEMAEQEARSRGCRYAYVDTLDFQAPGFYRQLGYQVAGTLKNWDSHGHDKILFTKDLLAADQL